MTGWKIVFLSHFYIPIWNRGKQASTISYDKRTAVSSALVSKQKLRHFTHGRQILVSFEACRKTPKNTAAAFEFIAVRQAYQHIYRFNIKQYLARHSFSSLLKISNSKYLLRYKRHSEYFTQLSACPRKPPKYWRLEFEIWYGDKRYACIILMY
jgi:hypothetical protein